MTDRMRILWPTDFSDASREAGSHAIALADRFGAEVHALHVVEHIAPSVPEAVRHMATFPEEYLSKAREAAEKELAAALPSDIAGARRVVRAVREGSALTQILDYAQDKLREPRDARSRKENRRRHRIHRKDR